MNTRYRLTRSATQPTPSEPSVLGINVKSFVTSPAAASRSRPASCTSPASPSAAARRSSRVEVSSDGGKTWIDAPFIGPDLGRFAWRQFALPLRMAAGSYVVTSRATDATGSVQPEQRSENAGGYANNSWADHAVKVVVA